MKEPDDHRRSPLPLSMLISESVYKLVVLIEGLIRWFNKTIMPTARLIYWCLRW